MTFLEFICEKLMGPAARRGVAGESYWSCPGHTDDHPSFHTLPSKPGKKDRFKCFSCGAWGDEFDLLKLYDPVGFADYGKRRAMLATWAEEYESLGYSYRGRGEQEIDPEKLDRAVAELKALIDEGSPAWAEGNFRPIRYIVHASDIATTLGVPWDAFAGRLAEMLLEAKGSK